MIRIITSLFILVLVAGAGESENPMKKAFKAFDALENYSVTIKTECCTSDEHIKYTFQKPGFVRMDFINPHEGAVLIYSPTTKKVRLKPFGMLSFVKLTLDPDNSLILSPKGHRVDQSDFSFLLKNVDALLAGGSLEVIGEQNINNRLCEVVKVSGLDGHKIDDISIYKLWLDKEIYLPLKVEAYDSTETLMESVLTADLQINTELDEDLFDM